MVLMWVAHEHHCSWNPKQRFAVDEVVFVGDGWMVKAKGKAASTAERIQHITALSEPQVRRLLRLMPK
jgi:hypothetical protein